MEQDIASGSDDHAWGVEMTASGSSRTDPIDRNSSAGSYATDVRTVGILQDSGGCAYVAQWESHHNEQDETDLYVSYTCGTTSTALGGAVTDDWDYNNLSKPSMAWYDGKLTIGESCARSGSICGSGVIALIARRTPFSRAPCGATRPRVNPI